MNIIICAFGFALAMLFASAASAQQLECWDNNGPVECFIKKLQRVDVESNCEFDVTMWQLEAEGVYGRSGSAPAKPNIHSCVTNQKNAVEPYYIAAREHLSRSNKDGLSVLKDAYSYWLASVDLLPAGVFLVPTAANIRANKAQSDVRKRGLAERLSRLGLEK